MIRIRTVVALCAGTLYLLTSVFAQVHAEEAAARRIPWQQHPLAIHLTVGEERLVHFSGPVSVGVPAAVDASLRTQTVNDTVYWRATAPFPITRVAVREFDTGRMYLFDLEAGLAATDNTPIRITVDAPLDETDAEVSGGNQIDYVSLTRFAAQQLYAPRRLLSPLPGVVRVPLQEDAVSLVPGGTVEARPLIAWRAGPLYLTAVKLLNRAREPQVLDPRTLRGEWLSATFQHARLLAAGNVADTTVVYLISAHPFEALELP